jgi:hypothetical protein
MMMMRERASVSACQDQRVNEGHCHRHPQEYVIVTSPTLPRQREEKKNGECQPARLRFECCLSCLDKTV